MANIIIVEDQTIMMEALKMLIEDQSEHRVVAMYNHPKDGLNYVRTRHQSIDLVIVDVRLPDMNGIEFTREVRQLQPELRVILLSQYANREYIKAGVEQGASGYLLKSVDSAELITAIEWVLEDRNYFCKLATKSLLAVNEEERFKMALSPREKEVLILIAKGFTVKEIAHKLHIKEATVNHYKEGIRSKLQLKKITDMTRYAYESGLIDLGNL